MLRHSLGEEVIFSLQHFIAPTLDLTAFCPSDLKLLPVCITEEQGGSQLGNLFQIFFCGISFFIFHLKRGKKVQKEAKYFENAEQIVRVGPWRGRIPGKY